MQRSMNDAGNFTLCDGDKVHDLVGVSVSVCVVCACVDVNGCRCVRVI